MPIYYIVMINSVIYFIVYILSKTFVQIFSLFGNIIIFGFVLYVLSTLTRKVYAIVLGSRAELFITGWIGTPVHELSHALFCVLFNHKVDDIKLFNTKHGDNTAGYVLHSYNTKSWYQQAGNFFIGVAPIIIGSIIIYLMLYMLSPEIKNTVFKNINTSYAFTDTIDTENVLSVIKNAMLKTFYMFSLSTSIIKNIFEVIIKNMYFKELYFWVFLYLSICIASHMELSPADLKHTVYGVVVIFASLLILNTALSLITLSGIMKNFAFGLASVEKSISMLINTMLIILLFSSVISFINFIFSYLILTPISILKNKKLINPFK